MVRSAGSYPTKLTCRVCVPGSARKVNLPSRSVVAPVVVPFNTTFTKGKGCTEPPSLLVMVPATVPFCASAEVLRAKRPRRTKGRTRRLRYIAVADHGSVRATKVPLACYVTLDRVLTIRY